jgi:hypothetical protein
VGIGSVWYEGNTCNMHLNDLAAEVKAGVVDAGASPCLPWLSQRTLECALCAPAHALACRGASIRAASADCRAGISARFVSPHGEAHVLRSGMVGCRINTVDVSDVISMGTDGMSFSLQRPRF